MIEYSGLNYNEVLALPYDLFLAMRKQHYVARLNETESGRKYLKDAQRLTQTEPDVEGLKRLKEIMKGGG